MKKVGINIIIVVTLLLLTIIAQEINSENLEGTPLEVYNYGFYIDKFIENNNPSQQKNILADYSKEFDQGIKDSLKDPEKRDKLAKAWLEKDDDKKDSLSDEAKNKIWDILTPEQKEEHLRKLIVKNFESRLDNIDPEKVNNRIKKIKLNENLKWEGNKLISENKDSKNWVDFDNVPIWTTSIEFNENNLQLKFDTGKGLKNVILTQGTINQYGEIIGPDGNLVGSSLHGGIQKINFDGKNFKVTYKTPSGGKSSILEFSKEELLTLARESKSEKIIGLVKNLDDEQLGPILKNLINDLNFESDLSFNKNEKLNILYGGNYQNEGTIEIDYDDLGKLKTSLSNGGNLVSTDSNGDVTKVYRQYYSKEGLSDPRFITEGDDEKGIFLFDFNGELEAAQNGIIKVREFGEARISRTDLIGVELVEDSLLAKIRRGEDFKSTLGSIEGLKELEKKVLSGKINSNKKLQIAIAEAITDELESKEFETDLKKELNNFLGSITTNLEKSQDSLLNDLLTPAGKDLTYDQNIVIDYTKDKLKSLTRKSVDAVSKDTNLKELIIGNEQKRRDIIKGIVKNTVKDQEVRPFINAIAEFTGNKPEDITPEKIDSFIDKIFLHSNSNNINAETNFRETIKTNLKEQGIEDENIINQIDSLFHDTEIRIDEEIKSFKSRLPTNYENKIIINTNINEVNVFGNKFIEFDAKTDLTKFTATSTRTKKDAKGDVIQLYSNGNFVAKFDGSKTSTKPPDSKANYNNINIIENTLDTSGRIASLQTFSSNYGPKWAITYPGSLRKTKTGPVTVVGVPTLKYYYAVDTRLISPDLSENFGLDIATEGSKIIINNYAAYGTGDPNYQRALNIGAALGEQEARNIPLLGRLDASRFGLGIFKRYGRREGIRRAHAEFLASQDPQKTANKLASEIRDGFNDQLVGAKNKQGVRTGGLYKAFGSQSNYENFARNTFDKYDSIFPQSALDKLYTSYNQNEFEKIPRFFEANPHAIYTITPTSITTNQGATLNNVDERIMRAFFRDFANEVKPRIEQYTP